MKEIDKKSVYYWNDVYENQVVYNPKEALRQEAIEAGLDWLTPQGGTVLDIGCGNGQMLLRTLEKGGIRVIGMDSSYHGISLARSASKPFYSTVSTKWIWGNLGSLLQLPDGCCQAVILSGILECLSEEEVDLVIHIVDRLLDRGGKLLLLTETEDLLEKFKEEFNVVQMTTLGYEEAYGISGEVFKGIMVRMER